MSICLWTYWVIFNLCLKYYKNDILKNQEISNLSVHSKDLIRLIYQFGMFARCGRHGLLCYTHTGNTTHQKLKREEDKGTRTHRPCSIVTSRTSNTSNANAWFTTSQATVALLISAVSSHHFMLKVYHDQPKQYFKTIQHVPSNYNSNYRQFSDPRESLIRWRWKRMKVHLYSKVIEDHHFNRS